MPKPMSQQVTAVLADKDESCMEHLESLLADLWPDLLICDRAGSGPEALELIRRHEPDLVFLDVRIPGMCGMQVARKVAASCRVVFTTACDHYAVNAFDSGASDYLVKPITRERLSKSVRRLKEQVAVSSNPPPQVSPGVERTPLASPLAKPQDYLQWLCVQQGDGVLLVPVEEVCHFMAEDKYTLVVTKERESLIKKPIKELIYELDPNRYWRIHRGTIVNVSQIDKVSRSLTDRGSVLLKARPEVLTVSRPYLNLFLQM